MIRVGEPVMVSCAFRTLSYDGLCEDSFEIRVEDSSGNVLEQLHTSSFSGPARQEPLKDTLWRAFTTQVDIPRWTGLAYVCFYNWNTDPFLNTWTYVTDIDIR